MNAAQNSWELNLLYTNILLMRSRLDQMRRWQIEIPESDVPLIERGIRQAIENACMHHTRDEIHENPDLVTLAVRAIRAGRPDIQQAIDRYATALSTMDAMAKQVGRDHCMN